MQNLELTEDEAAALFALLTRTINDDRYPLSPRIRTLKAILAKLRPEPAREPVPPPTVYAPPKATATRRRRAGSSVARTLSLPAISAKEKLDDG